MLTVFQTDERSAIKIFSEKRVNQVNAYSYDVKVYIYRSKDTTRKQP